MNSDGSADSIGVQPAVPEAPWRHAIRFVLVEPSHVGNIGAAARAIAAMGFARLCVVRPRDPAFGSAPEAVALAAAAGAVLAAAEVYATLEAALAGVDLAFATTGYARTMAGAPLEVRASAHQAAGAWHAQGAGIAFVFGTERTGLSNADVQRCHACCSIPCDPRMGSLNLAQAVQVVAYECRRALLAGDPDALQPAPRRDASQGALREADPAASETGKQQKALEGAMDIMDVTPEAIAEALRQAGVRQMVHGHTHRPARHALVIDGAPAVRWVLPDWEADAAPLRGGGLRLAAGALAPFDF